MNQSACKCGDKTHNYTNHSLCILNFNVLNYFNSIKQFFLLFYYARKGHIKKINIVNHVLVPLIFGNQISSALLILKYDYLDFFTCYILISKLFF